MSVAEIPLCTNQMDNEHPPCGLPMFRIGSPGAELGIGSAYVCEKCDKVSRDKSIDTDI